MSTSLSFRKEPCTFCAKEISRCVLKKHERACRKNPNRIIVKCVATSCEREAIKHKFCGAHLYHFLKGRISREGTILREWRSRKPLDDKRICRAHNSEGYKCNRLLNSHGARDLCANHYECWRRGSVDDGGLILYTKFHDPSRSCKVLGCTNKYSSRGFCSFHRKQYLLGILNYDGTERRRKCVTFESLMDNEDIFNRTFAKSCNDLVREIDLTKRIEYETV